MKSAFVLSLLFFAVNSNACEQNHSVAVNGSTPEPTKPVAKGDGGPAASEGAGTCRDSKECVASGSNAGKGPRA